MVTNSFEDILKKAAEARKAPQAQAQAPAPAPAPAATKKRKAASPAAQECSTEYYDTNPYGKNIWKQIDKNWDDIEFYKRGSKKKESNKDNIIGKQIIVKESQLRIQIKDTFYNNLLNNADNIRSCHIDKEVYYELTIADYDGQDIIFKYFTDLSILLRYSEDSIKKQLDQHKCIHARLLEISKSINIEQLNRELKSFNLGEVINKMDDNLMDVPRDGWCFFYAVNGALGKPYTDGDYIKEAEDLIGKVIQYQQTKEKPDKTKQYNEIYEPTDAKGQNTWATDNEISAVAGALGKCIYVFFKYKLNEIDTIIDEPQLINGPDNIPCNDKNKIYLVLDTGYQSNTEKTINQLGANGYVGQHFLFLNFKKTLEPSQKTKRRRIEEAPAQAPPQGQNYYENDKELLLLTAIVDTYHDFGVTNSYVGGESVKKLLEDPITEIKNRTYVNLLNDIEELSGQCDKQDVQKNIEKCFETAIINKILYQGTEGTEKLPEFDLMTNELDDKIKEEIGNLSAINVKLGEQNGENQGLFDKQKYVNGGISELIKVFYGKNNPPLEINSSTTITYASKDGHLHTLYSNSTAGIFDGSHQNPITYGDGDGDVGVSLFHYKENEHVPKDTFVLFELKQIEALSSKDYNKNKSYVKINGISVANRNCAVSNFTPKNIFRGFKEVRINGKKEEVSVPTVAEIINAPTTHNCGQTFKDIIIKAQKENDGDAIAKILMDWKRAGDFLQVKMAKENTKILVTGDKITSLHARLSGCDTIFVYQEKGEQNATYYMNMYKSGAKVESFPQQTREKQRRITDYTNLDQQVRSLTYLPQQLPIVLSRYNKDTDQCDDIPVTEFNNDVSKIISDNKNIVQLIKNEITKIINISNNLRVKANIFTNQLAIVGNILGLLKSKINFEKPEEIQMKLGEICSFIQSIYKASYKEITESYSEERKIAIILNSANDLQTIADINFTQLLERLNPTTGGKSKQKSNILNNKNGKRLKQRAGSNDIELNAVNKIYYTKGDIIVPFNPSVEIAAYLLKAVYSLPNINNFIQEAFLSFLIKSRIKIKGVDYNSYNTDDLNELPVLAIAEFLLEATTDLNIPMLSEFCDYIEYFIEQFNEQGILGEIIIKKTTGFSLKEVITEYLKDVQKLRYNIFTNLDYVATMYTYSVYKDEEKATNKVIPLKLHIEEINSSVSPLAQPSDEEMEKPQPSPVLLAPVSQQVVSQQVSAPPVTRRDKMVSSSSSERLSDRTRSSRSEGTDIYMASQDGGSSQKNKQIEEFENKLIKLYTKYVKLYKSNKEEHELKNELTELESKINSLSAKIHEYYEQQKKGGGTKTMNSSSSKSLNTSTNSSLKNETKTKLKEKLEKLRSERMIYIDTYGNQFNLMIPYKKKEYDENINKYNTKINKIKEKLKTLKASSN